MQTRSSRLKFHTPSALAVALLVSVLSATVNAEEMTPARKQFVNACGTCHAAEPNSAPRQGPNLFGIFGRKSGQVEGFKYSDPLKSADWTWDEATLERWITDSQSALPGTIMIYRQANGERRQLTIDYLKTLK
jgi:cytochrome c